MVTLATRRLIETAAQLEPADRALLNLWVNRRLDDDRLTFLTGMSMSALQGRRERIVAQLSAHLGLPEQAVAAALEQLTPDGRAHTAPNAGAAAAPEPTFAAPHRRRARWPLVVAVIGIAAAAIGVLAAAGGSSPRPRRASTSPPSAPRAPQPAAIPAPTNPAPGREPITSARRRGDRRHASGSVRLSGPVHHLTLSVAVRGVPIAHNGHHEVWLYNSPVDAKPLARLRNGHHRLTVRLPADARRYRWIDVSFQPPGASTPSGRSVLRASNPAHTTTGRLRRHAARTRHRLRPPAPAGERRRRRQAGTGSAARTG